MTTRPIRAIVAALAVAAVAASPTMALAQSHHHARHQASRAHKADPPRTSEKASENAAEGYAGTEADNDSAQQAAVCQKAGIDPTAPNVQYDDQTGTCTTDGSSGGNVQQ